MDSPSTFAREVDGESGPRSCFDQMIGVGNVANRVHGRNKADSTCIHLPRQELTWRDLSFNILIEGLFLTRLVQRIFIWPCSASGYAPLPVAHPGKMMFQVCVWFEMQFVPLSLPVVVLQLTYRVSD